MKPAHVKTDHLAGQTFKVDVATLRFGDDHRVSIENAVARFDVDGWLWLDTPEASYAVGGEDSLVMRIDPIAWI